MTRDIYISPIGKVSEEMVTMAARHASQMFGIKTEVYASFPEPDYAFDSGRRQHSSTLILRNLSKVRPSGALRFVGITEADLFIPMVTFVYGQAQLSGKVAVVSLARLDQGFYGLRSNKELLIRRARKEISHELGHTFGLIHCRNRSCIMSLSTEILQIDMKSEDFCPGCWLMLEQALAKSNAECNEKIFRNKGKVVELRK